MLPLFSILLFSALSHASDGSQLYGQHCAACHGQYAERHAWNVTSPIAGWKPDAVKQALLGYKSNNRDRYGYGAYMHPQVSKYTAEEIDAIARYIYSLGGTHQQETPPSE